MTKKKNQWTLITRWTVDMSSDVDPMIGEIEKQNLIGTSDEGRDLKQAVEARAADDCDVSAPIRRPGPEAFSPIHNIEEGRRVVGKGLSWTAFGPVCPITGPTPHFAAGYRLYEVTEFVIF